MPAPTLTVTAQELYDAIAPLVTSDQPGYDDSDNNYAGATLCAALATMVDPVSIIVRDQADGTPGYAILFQPNNADLPAIWLPWVAQFAGDSANVQAAPDEASQRALVANPINFSRGTDASIINAVGLALSQSPALSALGAARVALSWSSPFVLVVAVNFPTGSTIPASANQYVLDAISNALPAWVAASVAVVAGASYAELNSAHTTYTALNAAHSTYADMIIHPTA